MLWDVPYEWHSGAQFIFNCYFQWDNLVVREVDVSGYFLNSKEGVSQGATLAMINYGIGILPLIRELHNVHIKVTHIWYADFAGSGGNFAAL